MPQIHYSVAFTTAEVKEILLIQKAELKKTLAAYADNGSSVSKRRIDAIHTACKGGQVMFPSVSWVTA